MNGQENSDEAVSVAVRRVSGAPENSSLESTQTGVTLPGSDVHKPVVVQDVQPQPSLTADLTSAGDLDGEYTPSSSLSEPLTPPGLKKFSLQRSIGIGLLALGLLLGSFLLFHNHDTHKQQLAIQTLLSAKVKQQTVPLTSLTQHLSSSAASQNSALTVNGQLRLNNYMILQPIALPASAVAGELVYNLQNNLLEYYNGKQYVNVGSSSVNNKTTNVTNVTNVTNNTTTVGGGSSGVSAPGGTAGYLAMFSGGNTLVNSLVHQSGSTVNVGGTNVNIGTSGASEVVNLGSLTGSSSDAMQGGTGGVAINTGPGSGTSGSITIASGDSSTTAAGNVSIDTGSSIVNGTVIVDKTFEDGLDNMCQNYSGIESQSNVEAHSGSYSLAITVPLAGETWADGECEPFTTQVSAGHSYLISMYVRAGSVGETMNFTAFFSCDPFGCPTGTPEFASVTDNSNGWTHVTGTVVAPPGTNYLALEIFDAGYTPVDNVVHYFDDMTVTDLSSSSAVSELNLGTTNAQAVTIGNTAEIGPTDIYGGGSGVNIDTGVGSVGVTTNSFTVQNPGNFTTFDVDSSSNNVTINTSPLSLATSTSLAVKGLSSDTSTDALYVENNSGTNLETLGDDGQVDLGIGGGTAFGRTTATNNYWGGGNYGSLYAWQFTTNSGGTLDSMSAYNNMTDGPEVGAQTQYQYAIYTDNSGQPGNYVASTALANGAGGWQWRTLPITATLAASTPYWLVYWANGNPVNTGDGIVWENGIGLGCNNSYAWQGGPNNGLPATFPAGSSCGSSSASIYATFTGSSPALTVNSSGFLTQNGAMLIQDPTDITDAFQIQNSSGTALFTADTVDMTISIGGSLSLSGDISIGGHLITGGSTPGITADAAACTSPTVSVSGDDTSGTISVTTGTGCTSGGDLAIVGFAEDYTSSPHVIISPDSSASEQLGGYLDRSTITDSNFEIGITNTPADSTMYQWDYLVTQ